MKPAFQRAVAAFTGLSLGLFFAACLATEPTDAGPPATREPPPAPVGQQSNSSARTKVRQILVDGSELSRKVQQAPLRVEGFYKRQLRVSGLPLSQESGHFRWTAPTDKRQWPEELEATLPADGRTWLIAWIDLDGDGALSTGDRLSRPLPPLDPGDTENQTLRFLIDRSYSEPQEDAQGPATRTGPARPKESMRPRNSGEEPGLVRRLARFLRRGQEGMPGGRGGPGDPGGPDGGREQGPGRLGADLPHQLRPAVVHASAEAQAAGEGLLILYAFPSSALNDLGLPAKEARPIWLWIHEKPVGTWPLRLEVPLPALDDLRLVAVLDLDTDRTLGPGDFLGMPSPPVDGRADGVGLSLRIDRPLPSRDL